jgi:hypothetical protein
VNTLRIPDIAAYFSEALKRFQQIVATQLMFDKENLPSHSWAPFQMSSAYRWWAMTPRTPTLRKHYTQQREESHQSFGNR